jgi:hypothetical protein
LALEQLRVGQVADEDKNAVRGASPCFAGFDFSTQRW